MWQKIVGLSRSEGLRSASLTTIGGIISTVLGAIALILVSRLTTPSDFGLFSAVFAMMLMTSKLGDLGSNVALQRTLAQPELFFANKRASLASFGLYLKLMLFGLSLILLFLIAPWLTTSLNLPAGNFVVVGWLSMLGVILFDYFSIMAQSQGKFAVAVVGASLQSVVKIIAILALAQTGHLTPLNLIVLYGVAPLVAAIFLGVALRFVPKKLSFKLMRKHLLGLMPIIKWTVISVLAASLADNIDVLLIKSFLSSDATGYFSAGTRIASFLAVVGYSLGVVLNVRVAKYKTKEHIQSYLKKAVILALALLILSVVVAQFGYYLLVFTAGKSYLEALPVLTTLLYSTGITLATTPFVALFYTLDRPAYFAYSGVITAVVLVAADYYLIPSLGIMGAGYARILTRLAVLIFTLTYAKYAYEKRYGQKH